MCSLSYNGSRFESASIWYSLKLSNLMIDFTESIAFLSIVKIFICRYSPWQIRIFAIHSRFPSPLLILLLFPVNINECRVLQVSLVLRFRFKTALIIYWIYPIKTHSRETWGKSSVFIKLQYNIENSKAEIWSNNKSTVMHWNILTLNTALVFTLMKYCLINEQECFIRFKATSAQREWL
jgi:hypothetical protein